MGTEPGRVDQSSNASAGSWSSASTNRRIACVSKTSSTPNSCSKVAALGSACGAPGARRWCCDPGPQAPGCADLHFMGPKKARAGRALTVNRCVNLNSRFRRCCVASGRSWFWGQVVNGWFRNRCPPAAQNTPHFLVAVHQILQCHDLTVRVNQTASALADSAYFRVGAR